MIRVFVGYDPHEIVACNVFQHSVLEHSSQPVAFIPLAPGTLGNHYGESHADGSNNFIYRRFLVPYLCDYFGWAIFADGDMLCRDDIAKLWAMRDPNKAVQVVKHLYKTKHPVKYMGAKNEDYPRKNWSSLVLWNCSHPSNAKLTPDLIMQKPGAFLHRFSWLEDKEIGELPADWNWLVTEYPKLETASLVHFTLGAPCFGEYHYCDYSEEWHRALSKVLAVG
jgi:lipopolysaccharide biosynthesis glycosyltransferase